MVVSSQGHPKFGMCCFSGKIKIPKLDNPPLELLNLLSSQDSLQDLISEAITMH
jgi:hypothetical protein